MENEIAGIKILNLSPLYRRLGVLTYKNIGPRILPPDAIQLIYILVGKIFTRTFEGKHSDILYAVGMFDKLKNEEVSDWELYSYIESTLREI